MKKDELYLLLEESGADQSHIDEIMEQYVDQPGHNKKEDVPVTDVTSVSEPTWQDKASSAAKNIRDGIIT